MNVDEKRKDIAAQIGELVVKIGEIKEKAEKEIAEMQKRANALADVLKELKK